MVAMGRITGLPRSYFYHDTQISEKFYAIGVEEALDGKVDLCVTNEADDPPQLHLKDVVGSTTLWDNEYILLAEDK
jgi:hypothetical protein